MNQSLLMRLAWLNVVLHMLGLVLAVIGMRPGTALVPLADRLQYLAQGPLLWSAGWLTWMACAGALVAFLAELARCLSFLDRPGVVLRPALGAEAGWLAVGLALAGAAIDLFCDAGHITLLPMIASVCLDHSSSLAGRAGPDTAALFLVVDRLLNVGGLVVANGLYSVGILLVTMGLPGRIHPSPHVTALGYGVFGFGMLLVGAGFTGVAWHAEWATAPTIGLFCLWVICVARAVQRSESKP